MEENREQFVLHTTLAIQTADLVGHGVSSAIDVKIEGLVGYIQLMVGLVTPVMVSLSTSKSDTPVLP